MTQRLEMTDAAYRKELQRRVDRSVRLLSALFLCLWITRALARFYPKTLGLLFIPGFLFLVFAAWIYAACRLGCPRCGLWRIWRKGGYCCVGCALPVGKQKPGLVSGSVMERERRWALLPRHRNIWKAALPAFLVALLITAAFALTPKEQVALWAGVALIGIVASGVITRFLLLRCPDCNGPLEGTRSENFCGACGACFADRAVSRPYAS